MIEPKIAFFVYSESAAPQEVPPVMEGIAPGQRLNLVGVQAMLRPLFVPGLYSFSINVGILGIDITEKHFLRFVFRYGEKVIVDTQNQQMAIGDPSMEKTLPAEETHIISSIGLGNVLFEEEGWYTTDVYADDKLLGSYPIPVRQAKRI